MNKEEHNIAVDLTKKQIENSPSLDSDKPVSRQFEERLLWVLCVSDILEWPLHVGSVSLRHA